MAVELTFEIFEHERDDALLTSEMLSDYLEQAAPPPLSSPNTHTNK